LNQSFGGKPQEDTNVLRMRLKERMYHHNRAVTAKDYELMILNKFSDINAVKCFQHRNSQGENVPGSLLLVVMPFVPVDFVYNGQGVLATNLQLQRVLNYAQSISPDGITIEVRNPAFDKIQVRCKVKFTGNDLKGEAIRHFEKDINRFIAYWLYDVTGSVFLGKGFYLNDLFTYLSALSYVDYITGFSVLRVYKSGRQTYALFDSGRSQAEAVAVDRSEEPEADTPLKKNYIQPYNIWGTFIPSVNHMLVELDKVEFTKTQNAGLHTLQIDEDFIIQ